MDNSFDTSSGKVAICVEYFTCDDSALKALSPIKCKDCEYAEKRYRPLSSSELEAFYFHYPEVKGNVIEAFSTSYPFNLNNKPVKLVALEG
jgi:hypothetical protein